MKKRKDLALRKIGKQYMIVENSDNTINLTNVYTLNGSAAYLWEQIGDDEFDTSTLVHLLCEKYEVEENIAQEDAESLIHEWQSLGLVKGE